MKGWCAALVGCMALLAAQPAFAEPDSGAVYGEGVVYERDVGGNRLRFTTHQLQTDDLVLSSGAIVVADAFFVFGAQPLDHVIDPGSYRVMLTLTTDQNDDVRVAFARAELVGTPAVRWEYASTYVVRSGTAALMDQDVLNQALADYDPYGSAILGALTSAVEQNEYWTSVPIVPETGADAVIMTSGYGDGTFNTYWGLDENDVPVVLLADFNVLGR